MNPEETKNEIDGGFILGGSEGSANTIDLGFRNKNCITMRSMEKSGARAFGKLFLDYKIYIKQT